MKVIAWGDVPTWGLLVGAAITAWYAKRAFGKQSEELTALKTEVADGQTLIQQQSELIKIQSGQLLEQRKLTTKQIEVLELQRSDLEASVAERKREAEDRESAQAAMVATWFGSRQIDATYYPGSGPAVAMPGATVWGAFLRNASHLPVFQVRVFFHYVQEEPGGNWTAAMRGGPVERIRVIPPGADRFAEIPDQVRKMLDQCDDQVYVTSIEFTDAAGTQWERDSRGALKRL